MAACCTCDLARLGGGPPDHDGIDFQSLEHDPERGALSHRAGAPEERLRLHLRDQLLVLAPVDGEHFRMGGSDLGRQGQDLSDVWKVKGRLLSMARSSAGVGPESFCPCPVRVAMATPSRLGWVLSVKRGGG